MSDTTNDPGKKEVTHLPVENLRGGEWVLIECRPREKPSQEGIFYGGGCIIGQFYPDVYYRVRYGVNVVIIQSIFYETPFFVLAEDIIDVIKLETSVPDD